MNKQQAENKRNWYISIGAVDAIINIAVFGRSESEHLYTVTPIW